MPLRQQKDPHLPVKPLSPRLFPPHAAKKTPAGLRAAPHLLRLPPTDKTQLRNQPQHPSPCLPPLRRDKTRLQPPRRNTADACHLTKSEARLRKAAGLFLWANGSKLFEPMLKNFTDDRRSQEHSIQADHLAHEDHRRVFPHFGGNTCYSA